MKPEKVFVDGRTLEEDLEGIMPFGRYLWTREKPEWLVEDSKINENPEPQTANSVRRTPPNSGGIATSAGIAASTATGKSNEEAEEAEEDGMDEAAIKSDVGTVLDLLDLVECFTARQKGKRGDEDVAPAAQMRHGADVLVCLDSGFVFPSHKFILASRSETLKNVMSGQTVKDSDGRIRVSFRTAPPSSRSEATKLPDKLKISGTDALSTLLLATYLYTDSIPCIWDRRIADQLIDRFARISPRTDVSGVKAELTRLSRLLRLKELEDALSVPIKRPVVSSLGRNFGSVFREVHAETVDQNDPIAADVVLQLADALIYAHSAVLRARSPFFAALFGDNAWLRRRMDSTEDCIVQTGESVEDESHCRGMLCVNLKHRHLREMSYAMRFIYENAGEELFDILPFTQSTDDILEFLYSVLDIAEELLLERLTQVCAERILPFFTTTNACALLTATAPYPTRAARQLVRSAHSFLARSLETLLESRMLDDLPHSLVRGLARFVCELQREKMPVTRSGTIAKVAMEKWKEWVEQQDWPMVIVRSRKVSLRQVQSPSLSPTMGPGVAKAGGKGRNKPLTASSDPSLSLKEERRARTPLTPPSAPLREVPEDDEEEIFDMEGIPPMSLSSPAPGSGLQTSLPSGSPRPSLTPVKKGDSPSIGGPWKIQAAAAARCVLYFLLFDCRINTDTTSSKSSLRSIMAEAENKSQAQVQRPSTPTKTPERPRLPLSHDDALRALIVSTTPPTSTVPVPTATNRTPSRTAAAPRTVSFKIPAAGSLAPSGQARTDAQPQPGPSGLQAQRPVTALQNSQAALGKGKAPMGPTFTPTRQPTPSHSSPQIVPMARRVSYVLLSHPRFHLLIDSHV